MEQERNPAAVLRASRRQPMRIGEWLVRKRVIDRVQLLRALSVSHRGNWRLGDVVVAMGFAPSALVEAEAEILRMRRGARGTRRLGRADARSPRS